MIFDKGQKQLMRFGNMVYFLMYVLTIFVEKSHFNRSWFSVRDPLPRSNWNYEHLAFQEREEPQMTWRKNLGATFDTGLK